MLGCVLGRDLGAVSIMTLTCFRVQDFALRYTCTRHVVRQAGGAVDAAMLGRVRKDLQPLRFTGQILGGESFDNGHRSATEWARPSGRFIRRDA